MPPAVRALALLVTASVVSSGLACGTQEQAAAPLPGPAAVAAEAAPPSPSPVPTLAPPEQPPRPAGKRAAPSAENTRMLGTALTQAALIDQLQHAEPLDFKPVGSTSTVFRTRLAAPFEAAFKAATHDRPHGPLAEIGAAAIARCLGIDTVPAAVARTVSLEFLRAHQQGVSEAQWSEIAARLETTKNGRVPGALIYWIPDLGEVGLNKDEGLSRAREWLRVGGALPEAEKKLARSVSVMLGFDYVIGNFDRWSGSNTKGNAAKSSVYVRDHDLALPGRLGEPLHKRLAAQMTVAQRVSRGFYAYAQGLSRACIEREVALAQPERQSAHEKLSEQVIAGVLDRRDGFLSHVQSLIALHGEQPVLFFD